MDGVYMAACQALTGSGGWPLTILMTPDQKPFWAGTYLPPRGENGRPGLIEVLEEVERLWREDRHRLMELGRQVTRRVADSGEAAAGRPDRALLRRAAEELRRRYDPVDGGFGGAPKFPNPGQLLLLLDRARREEDRTALDMAERTLTQMARGGIFDQLGGGFCRYSTDSAWRLPHFEKMLCDNALLAYVYLEAYAQTGRARDVEEVLGVGEAAAFCRRFGIGAEERVPQLLDDGRFESAWRENASACARLAAFRRRRHRLHRDEKVLTAWNALAIAALAKAGRVLGETRYLRAAEDARLFLKTRLTRPDGRLYLRWLDREPAVEGQLEDYALYCWALLELYGANFSVSCLREAAGLGDRMAELFEDREAGGFYRAGQDSEVLIARQKEVFDAAMPSGNAAAALALVGLARLTGESRFRALAGRQLNWLAGQAGDYPSEQCFALLAMAEALYPGLELVCVSAGEVPDWLAGVGEAYRLTALAKTADKARGLARVAPYTADYPIPAEGIRLYLCREGACQAPADTLEGLRRLLADRVYALS